MQAIDNWLINEDPNEWLILIDLEEDILDLPKNLKLLEIKGCKNLKTINNLPQLTHLIIIKTPVTDLNIPLSLIKLVLDLTNITNIDTFSTNLRHLEIYSTYAIEFGPFPSSLRNLTLIGFEVDMPTLPKNLRVLDLQGMRMNELPKLPDNLLYLDIRESSIKEINELPIFLEELNIGSTLINRLPELPRTLEILDCHLSMLREIPELPSGLKELYCASMPFIFRLPSLPEGLKILSAYMNIQLECLPKLPSTLNELYLSETGISLLNDLPQSINLIELYSCPNLLIEYEFGETVQSYNARWEKFFEEKAISACKMIKEELLHVTWEPDYIMNYINKYGMDSLKCIN